MKRYSTLAVLFSIIFFTSCQKDHNFSTGTGAVVSIDARLITNGDIAVDGNTALYDLFVTTSVDFSGNIKIRHYAQHAGYYGGDEIYPISGAIIDGTVLREKRLGEIEEILIEDGTDVWSADFTQEWDSNLQGKSAGKKITIPLKRIRKELLAQ